MPSIIPVRRNVLHRGSAAAPAVYTGPGNVVSSASAWWGLRGYTTAYSTGSNPAVDLVDQAGANPITINILSNGNLDTASISIWVTANTVTTIKVAKLYDQTGNARHVIQGTLANMPVLTLNAIGTLPLIQYAGGSQALASTGFLAFTQPFWVSLIFKATGASSYFGVPGGTNILCYRSAVNTFELSAGTSLTATVSDNAFHAVQAVANSTSSDIYVDGTANVGNAGTTSNTNTLFLGSNTFTSLTGFIGEAGWWPIAPTTPNKSAMDSNQHTYWGF